MDIYWLGHSCFRLKAKQATLVTDPFVSTGPDDPWPQPTAQILTVSHGHPGHSNIAGVEGSPKVLAGPGEYEVAGAFILGFATFHDAENGSRLGRNTIYLIDIDGIRVCHLGDLGHPLSPQQVEALEPVDVLLVPIGGGSNLGIVAAAQTVRHLEPRLIIPMHYAAGAGLRPAATETPPPPPETLDKFAHEMGLKPEQPVPRLSVTRSNLPAEARIVVMTPGR